MTSDEEFRQRLIFSIIGFNVTVIVVMVAANFMRTNPWTTLSAIGIGFLAVLLGGAAAAATFFLSGNFLK